MDSTSSIDGYYMEVPGNSVVPENKHPTLSIYVYIITITITDDDEDKIRQKEEFLEEIQRVKEYKDFVGISKRTGSGNIYVCVYSTGLTHKKK